MEMKLIKTLALSMTLMAVSLNAMANLYKPGTEFHGYVAQLEKFIPGDVDVMFVRMDDRKRWMTDLKPEVLNTANVKSSMARILAQDTSKVKTQAFASMIKSGNKDLCVVFARSEAAVKAYYMHEVMHCIQLSAAEVHDMDAASKFVLNASFKGPNKEAIDHKVKLHVLAEQHAMILSHVIMEKAGITADRRYVEAMRKYEAKMNAENSLEYGIALCTKVSCPTDASDLMSVLLKDKGFVEALRKDFLLLPLGFK